MGAQDFKSLGRCKIIAAIRDPDPLGSSAIGFFTGLQTSTLRNVEYRSDLSLAPHS
ncbi:MAG TPA: hypothetical protein VK789_07240 [Bryobacteraceae bacterium]|jgi:hypothetical protein|nr:hypothetical protein [Bryobacteraceae bacterium]